ncbi:MAG: class I SAM-dependent methyltransferase, partial [Pseudomonadota bacterium]|nr:class I SAM-dependent methyltransferase [Pseudomonadota bacterium]
RYYHSEEWQSIRAHLPDNRGNALDVGAGRGIASYALSREGYFVTALEPDPSAIVGAEAIRSLARESDMSIEVTEEFSERLSYPDNQFDLVFARAVLHHTTDLPAACREFYRVLKPGGRLIAAREHVLSSKSDLGSFLAQHPLHKLYGGENAFLLEEYERAITSAGFKLIHSVAPFDSAMNIAPRTLNETREEIASRFPVGAGLVSKTLRNPAAWKVAKTLLRRFDNRPGRLYSFVADKV